MSRKSGTASRHPITRCSPGWRAGGRSPIRPMLRCSVHPCWRIPWKPRTSLPCKPEDWRAEWKWDGIRVQLVATTGGRRLYSRGADDISDTFPEIVAAMDFRRRAGWRIAGHPRRRWSPRSPTLQQRLNRKTVTAKIMEQYPVAVRLYDLLFDGDRGSARTCRLTSAGSAWKAWIAQHPPGTDGPVAADPLRLVAGTDGAARWRARRLDRGPDAEARRQRCICRAGSRASGGNGSAIR